jgi:hypothetical protein
MCIISIFWGTFNVAALSIARYAWRFWPKDAVCAVGLSNSATATSCGIRNQCVWQKVSGSEARYGNLGYIAPLY